MWIQHRQKVRLRREYYKRRRHKRPHTILPAKETAFARHALAHAGMKSSDSRYGNELVSSSYTGQMSAGRPAAEAEAVRLAAEALREETAVRRDVIEALHRRVEELERELAMRAVQEV